jgi:hypothetical protein
MNASRVTVWVVVAAASGAWLASAAGVTRQARITRVSPVPPETIQLDTLALEVQTQAGRLRERLANAPAPRASDRNPFSFDSAPVRRHSPMADVAATAGTMVPVAPEVREPALELIGIAESNGPAGPVRTAMIAGEQNDLIMVAAGQRILGRYEVVTIGEDVVELKDVQTGATRRLILR